MPASPELVCIGIDIGGTNIRFTLVDRNGAVLYRERQATHISRGRDFFLERLFSVITSLGTRALVTGQKVVAIGVGVPGLVSNDGFIYSSVNLQPLEGVNLKDMIISATGLPTVVINDANAGAWGEKCFGAGSPYKSFLMLTLGTGVGSGLVLNDTLWTGCDGVAGEYGHATVEPDGLPCLCGNHGCLEQYASAKALVSAAQDAVKRGEGGSLAELSAAELDAETIADAARHGNPLSLALFERAGRYLGIAAASAVNLLNLEAIILGGGVSESYDLLAEPIMREISGRAFAVPGQRVRLVKCSLGDDAGILGATAIAMKYILE